MSTDREQAVHQHPWKFFRAGGFDQVQLDSGADLLALGSLDQKLWVALSCPVDGVEFDRRTLELIDTDKDGHIRSPEILGALDFAAGRLKTLDLLLKGEEGLPLEAIDGATAEGARLLASARTVLERLGKADAGLVTIEDVCDTEKICADTPFNGDGIITAESTGDAGLKGWISNLIDCLGGELDRSGAFGVSVDRVEQFDAEVATWLAWQGEVEPFREGGITLDHREAALELYALVKAKIEDFFLRCRLAAYDSRAAVALNASDEQLLALSPGNLGASLGEIEALPLAAVSPGGLLDLARGVNPAWGERLDRFRQEIVLPLLGEQSSLSLADWETIKEQLAWYESWWEARVGERVAVIGMDRLVEWQATGVKGKLLALIEQDLALKEEFESIVELERLVRYCRDLYRMVNNFVTFRDFYSRRDRAIFQAGTLYLDGRSCELCVPVQDIAKHAVLATMSRVFLVYCDCIREGGAEKMTIAAAFTNGDSDQLVAGRNGVFFDRQGRDWDATIIRIIEHPISIRQAFWSPYKRVGRMVGEQIQKMAAARSKAAEEKAAVHLITSAMPAKEGAKPVAQPAFDVGKFAGIFAAIGLAAGAMATAIAAIATGFFKLAWWQMPLAIVGVMLLISGPSIVIACFKLRQRNLGPILDANGWAVNGRVRLNIPFGASLTAVSTLPKGSSKSMVDPYGEKKSSWKAWLLLAVILVMLAVAWRGGCLKCIFTCPVPPVANPAK